MINTRSATADAPSSSVGVHAAGNLQMMSQTVLSGSDPALADLAGTSAKISGTDPTGYIQQLAASWFGTTAPGQFANGEEMSPRGAAPGGTGTAGEQAVGDPTWLTKSALAVLAIGLILIGAIALVFPSAEKAMTRAEA